MGRRCPSQIAMVSLRRASLLCLPIIIIIALLQANKCASNSSQDEVTTSASLMASLFEMAHDGPEVDASHGFTIDSRLTDSIEDEQHSRELMLKEDELEHELEHETPGQKTRHIFGRTCPYGFFTCANGECISAKWRCDGIYDCDDFSDELNCTTIDILSGHEDMKLDHSTSVPAKPAIQPQLPTPNLKLPREEVSEIKFNATQEPLMLFSTGLSVRGYWMRSRIYFDVISMGMRPVKHDSPSITQALSIFFDILNIDNPPALAKRPESVTVKARSTIVGIDMDPNDKQVFWVELGKDAGVFSTLIDDDQFESRHRRQFDGPKRKTIVDSGLLSPEDLALDIVGKNIYITDAGLPAIVACSIKHSHCKMIVKENLHKPRAIIADPSTGWLTYTDWGDHPGIFLVSMDGKRRETLIDSDVVWPNGLAADYVTNQLYWADARLSKIERIDLVTRKRREVIKESAANPFSLSLFENRIYWSDWSGSDIRTCDKMSGNGTKVIMRTENIYGIHIFHPTIYGKSIDQENPCWSMHCSHMCLLAPISPVFANRKPGAVNGTCACPEDMALSIGDRATCYDVQLSFLLINVKNYIAQVTPDKIGLRTVEKIIYSKEHIIHDVASDWLHYRLFFFDAVKQHIYSVDLADNNVKIEQFMPTSQSVRGLLYDPWSDNLYWIDSDRGTMSMCSVRGRFETVIRKDLERPISMVLDSKNRVFYIAALGSMPHIMRTDIYGAEKSDLMIIGTDIGLPVALHLDEQQQRLYWADARRESIESLDLDVKSVSSGIKPNSRICHRRRLGTILAFTVYHNHFLWTIKNGDYLYKARMSEQPGSVAKVTDEPRPLSLKLPPNPSFKDPSSDNKRIILVDPRHDVVSSPCQNRGCSHGCVLEANNNAVCVCPDAYKLQATNRSNCLIAAHQECAPNMFKCLDTSHCILNTWKCDGTADCEDGSDEKECHLQPECPSGDFTCKNGHCISQAWHCDSTDDCGDNSDEENCPRRVDNSCTVGYFPCGDGKCIPQLWRCDREKDCARGTDEKDCRTEECKPNFFRCKENNCIPHNWVCDKTQDCVNGEDEENCAEATCKPGEQFLCDQHLCLDARLKCDGRKDCVDGTDELNCTEHRACPAHMLTCPSDRHCIYPIDMCDGHQDCEDGFDERNCTNLRVCASYEIQCESLRSGSNSSASEHKKCIPRAWLCDGQDDCGDWSDEINEKCLPPSYEHMVTTTSKPCHDGSFPCQSGECIKWSQVCDSEDNCLDGSDEGGKCIVACSINNGGCAQQCRPSPHGPSCACYDGYTMSNDTKSCEDIDECQHVGICSQLCHNFKGGYKCSCAPGYLLAADKRHCKAMGDEPPFILFMLPSKILSTGIVHYEETLIASVDDVDMSGMDFDYQTGLVFWSERDKGQVLSQSWRKPHEATQIELSDLNKPAHLAWDWASRNLYFSQTRGTVHMCNVDTKRCTMLFNGRIIKCNSLAVAPTVGYMFWGVSSDDTSSSGFVSGIIERAELDGTHRKTIVSEKVHSPIGLAVDFVLERLYWTDLKIDVISAVDFSGRGRINILSYSLQNPAGLSLFEDSLFVSNVGSDALMRCNKFSGNSRLTLHQGDAKSKSNILRVVHQVNQPYVNNTCLNSGCQYLCALSNSTGHGCVCPTGQILASDRRTCRPFDRLDCGGDSARCNAGTCKPSGAGWRCDCPTRTWGPFCDSNPPDTRASALSSDGFYADDSFAHNQPGNKMIWMIVLLLLLSVTGLVTVVSLLILYRQGRLPRQVSQLSVSFISHGHDKDGAMLLLDNDT